MYGLIHANNLVCMCVGACWHYVDLHRFLCVVHTTGPLWNYKRMAYKYLTQNVKYVGVVLYVCQNIIAYFLIFCIWNLSLLTRIGKVYNVMRECYPYSVIRKKRYALRIYVLSNLYYASTAYMLLPSSRYYLMWIWYYLLRENVIRKGGFYNIAFHEYATYDLHIPKLLRVNSVSYTPDR
jgi:hypothetical protein